MHHRIRSTLWQLIPVLPLIAGACSSQPDNRAGGTGETTAVPAAGTSSADSAGSPSIDQAFLRTMSDHEKGLILIAHETLERKTAGAIHDEAQTLDKTHDEEVDRLHTALRGFFQDDYTATVTPEDQAAVDSLVKLTGPAFDPAFLQAVIAQDEQGVKLIDRYLSTLTRADVKTLAGRLREGQMREIDAFKARLGKG